MHDLLLSNGNLSINASDEQHVELLILLQKGELKELPFVGFGIEKRLKAVTDQRRFIRELKVEIEGDGYNSAVLDISPDLSTFKITI